MIPSHGGGGGGGDLVLRGWGGAIFKEITVIQKGCTRVYNSAEFAIPDSSYVLFMLLNNIMIDLIKGGILRGAGWLQSSKKLLQIYGKGEKLSRICHIIEA